MKDTYIYTSR